MLKAKESRDIQQKRIKKTLKTPRDREFPEDLWGDFAETRRVDRGHWGLQNIPPLCFASIPF